MIFKFYVIVEREWEWVCFDVYGDRVEVCGLDLCLFISFREIVFILIDFFCGKKNGLV